MKPEKHNPLASLRNGSKLPLDDKKEMARFTPVINAEILEKLKDYLYWTPGENYGTIIEDLLLDFFAKEEKKNGEIKPRPKGARIKTGRPIK